MFDSCRNFLSSLHFHLWSSRFFAGFMVFQWFFNHFCCLLQFLLHHSIADCIESNITCNRLFSSFILFYYCCIQYLDRSVYPVFHFMEIVIQNSLKSVCIFQIQNRTNDKWNILYNSYSRNRQPENKKKGKKVEIQKEKNKYLRELKH